MARTEGILLAAAALAVAAAAMAAETITYTYDGQGQLVKVVHNGSVNAKAVTTYSYDNAANITNKTTTGAPQ